MLRELSSLVRVSADEAHLETNAGSADAPLFVSDVRATAALSLLLLKHEPAHALLPKLARWLASARERDGGWRSTHESAWGLMALSAYLESKERARPELRASAQVGERQLGPVRLQGHRAKASFHLPMRDLPTDGAPIALEQSGAGVLHYTFRLGYAQRELPRAASERGFFIERSYARIEPGALARGEHEGTLGERANVGDYVRVRLLVAVPAARRFVLITDPLPAGLEPVDFKLASELSGAARALHARAPYDHYELRDDRAVFAIRDLPPGLYRYEYLARASSAGSFLAPPAKAEEMYHPETYGLTPAHHFEVAAP